MASGYSLTMTFNGKSKKPESANIHDSMSADYDIASLTHGELEEEFRFVAPSIGRNLRFGESAPGSHLSHGGAIEAYVEGNTEIHHSLECQHEGGETGIVGCQKVGSSKQ